MFSPYRKMSVIVGIILCLFSSVFAYSGGSGTEIDPYRIAAVSDWQQLMSTSSDWNKYFIMTADVNLQGITLTPVGNYSTKFIGVFNGNGHIIRNANINMPTSDYIGLFGYIRSSHCQINNLGVADVNITGRDFVGGLVGGNSGGTGTITDCYASGTVAGASCVGGLAGYNFAVITACYSTGTVAGGNYVGGLVGFNYEGNITACYSTGTVNGGDYRIGGLVGGNYGLVGTSFWDIETSGITNSAGGTGKTTAEMKTLSTFTSAGWDFTTDDGDPADWIMPENDYPRLAWKYWKWDKIPDVNGMSFEEATDTVKSTGFPIGSLILVNSQTVPVGYIVSQDPPADSNGTVGVTKINMVISCPNQINTGSGTETDPYQIRTVYEWLFLTCHSELWGKYFILMNDIDFRNGAISPIGNWGIMPFIGVFDGNGHIIRNVVISMPGNDYVGLFGYIERSSRVCNLGVEGVGIIGDDTVGGLVGLNSGSVTNCHSTGNVSGNIYTGGLCGFNMSGSISNCYSTGNVSGNDDTGGLCGANDYGSITNCYSTGNVTGGRYDTGGLCGVNDYGSITDCYSTGNVGGSRYDTGGLCGFNYGSITDCYSTGNVGGNNSIGGLCAANGGSITDCYSTGNVTGDDYVGGLCAANGGSITDCYSTGNVTGDDYVGGLVGQSSNGSITDCYATGAVKGDGYIGGLLGRNYKYKGSINACFWDVETSGQTSSAGGVGKTTVEMKTLSTFTSAGWDFIGETANGTKDIWTICQGVNYPKFVWQNQPPIAEAGPDQTVYAWIDGIAEVDLDGFGSSDPDCNELTYYWSWVIDGNTCEANGANPTIELPVGVHTIQLVVNDGLADCVPDDVNITVIAPLKSKLEITPCVINRSSYNRHKSEKILAFVRMPEGIARKDISNEPLTLYPGDIEASRQWVIPIPYGFGRNRKLLIGIFAFFDKNDVLDAIPTNGRVELKVAGELTCGRYFYGSDTVTIIGPKRPWPWYFPKK